MIKSYFSKILILFTTILISSCSTSKITSSVKFIQYPGVPSGTPFISYEVTINSPTDFSIEKVALSKNGKSELFAIQNLKSHVYSNPKSELFSKGIYQILFKNKAVSKIDKEENVYLLIKVGNKLKWLTHKFEKKKALHSK